MTSNHNMQPRDLLPLLPVVIAVLVALAGCDSVVPEEGMQPDEQVAASLAASSRTAATVDENMEMALVFDSPMGETLTDLGLDEQGEEFDPWTGGGISYPERAAANADGFRSHRELSRSIAMLPERQRAVLLGIVIDENGSRALDEPVPGDTLSVDYYDSPDSSGVDAVILVEAPSRVRFVSLRSFPDRIGPTRIRSDSELHLDTMGTWEDGTDDLYYSARAEEEWDSGTLAVGEIVPESGDGPLGDGLVVATQRIDGPQFRPMQEWRETRVTFAPGELDDPEDDVSHSFVNTVHWVSGAEHSDSIRDEAGGPITSQSTVTISALFTAAPANAWIETTADTLRAQLGDLESESDDLLLEMRRSTVLDGVAGDGGSPRSSIRFTPETPLSPGEEPCGGSSTQSVYYPDGWWLQSLERDADMNCDGSGTLHTHMEFLDGSSVDRTITWDGAGGATLNETRPDGTQVSGIWSESTGEYETTTVFPAGNDPIRREQSGHVEPGSIEAADEYIWQDGHVDRTNFSASESEDGFEISGARLNGDLAEEFTLVASAGGMEGSWSRNATGTEAAGEFMLEELDGGGKHLVFSARDTAADGEPEVAGESWFAPDGSGHGTLTVTQYGVTVTYTTEWEAGGEGVMSDLDGNETPLG